MTRRKSNVVVETRDIVLKTIHNDIMKSNANATIDTKKMRVMLRKEYAHIHAHNNAWVFTQNEYNEIRARYDAKFAKSLTQTNATPKRARKSRVIVDNVNDTNDVVTNNETINA